MASPRPYVVATSGPAEDAPAGAVPIDLYGADAGGGSGAVESVNGKTGAVTLSASDVGARADGNVPWGDIDSVPAALTSAQAAGTASIRAIGTTATTAAAGNHTHTATNVTATAIGPGTATNVQGILGELAARIAALEAAAG